MLTAIGMVTTAFAIGAIIGLIIMWIVERNNLL